MSRQTSRPGQAGAMAAWRALLRDLLTKIEPKPRRNVMNVYVVGAYIAYLTISISLTVWVARTLVKNGRIFLVDSFLGNESLADSVNHLLAVGFYLVNVGYVSLALKYGDKPADLAQAIESLSTKVGLCSWCWA